MAVFLSIFLYGIFGLIGIFLLTKINFIKKYFSNQQNIIYLSIFFIVYGFFLGQRDPGNLGIAYQIGFGIGNYLSAFLGAIAATFIAKEKKSKFSIKNKLFFHALTGSILLGTILLIIST